MMLFRGGSGAQERNEMTGETARADPDDMIITKEPL
jgi:hypothetical protein